jgi:hypothetical protein
MAVMMLLLHHHGYPSSLRNKDERWKICRKTPQPQQMLQAQMVCKERERENVANAERLHATTSDLEPAQRERRALLHSDYVQNDKIPKRRRIYLGVEITKY